MSATTQTATLDRAQAERLVASELEAWRVRMLPDPRAPLDADDLARLVRSCLDALGVGDAGKDFSVNTVHYYRRKDILDAPAGRTSAARYDVRHVWQAVGARLAGHLGLATLAEARDVMRGAKEPALIAFAAGRVLDARSRRRLRESAEVVEPSALGATPTHAAMAGMAAPVQHARPLPGVTVGAPAQLPVAILLPGDAYCILPPSHPAHRSAPAARELVRALAHALGVDDR
jgi:hypothetical protein